MFCQGCWGSVPEPEPRADLSAMELVGYQTSRKEMRDIYHSVYLLRRTPGTSSCGEQERRRVIHDILASLTVQLQRQTQPAQKESEFLQPQQCKRSCEGRSELLNGTLHGRPGDMARISSRATRHPHMVGRTGSCAWY